MIDPMRFMSRLDDGSVLTESNDPQEVQRAAEEHAEAHPDQAVHLYQHVFSVKRSDDGN